MADNPYVPEKAVLRDVVQEAPGVKTFRIQIENQEAREKFNYRPGQFVQLTAFGVGEAPISISSAPSDSSAWFECTIRQVGNVTKKLHELGEGEFVGVRGPFGNGYPLARCAGKDLAFLAGGVGLAPLRSAIRQVLAEREKYGKLTLFYGARSPDDVIFKDDLLKWQEAEVDCFLTVDVVPGTCSWTGGVGLVTSLMEKHALDPAKTIVLSCGPPVMIKCGLDVLAKAGFSEEQVFVSLERHMKCGIGKCGHCMARGKYVCRDGPVFSYAEAKTLEE